VFAGIALGYFLVAYIALPDGWTHYDEHQKGLAALPAITRTAQGIPGDPINIGLIGTKEDIVCAMHHAGWNPADPVTLRTSLHIIGSVVLDRAYPDAPVSPLYFMGHQQALAFEKPDGISADKRGHVRLWEALDKGEEKRPVWLGSATFDRGVGLSRYTGAVTHHIAPDVDRERKQLTDNLNAAGMVEAIYQVSGIGPTINGRNGEGDLYYTDGEIWLSRLVEGCKKRLEPAVELSNPTLITIKNLIWKGATTFRPPALQ